MSDDLREVIEHINSANKSRDESEPLVQISKVLNAHMVSWLALGRKFIKRHVQVYAQMSSSKIPAYDKIFIFL